MYFNFEDFNNHTMIPFDKLTDTANNSEDVGYIDGEVQVGDMVSVCLFFIIIVFLLIFIFYKIINFIYIRRMISKISN